VDTGAAVVPVSASETPDAADGAARIPDVRGKPLRHALATLAPLRTAVEVEGSGLVMHQSPAPGAPVTDTPVRLTLGRPGEAAGARAGRK
jgi:hypothetical protein